LRIGEEMSKLALLNMLSLCEMWLDRSNHVGDTKLTLATF
jgi:hypothetical protein